MLEKGADPYDLMATVSVERYILYALAGMIDERTLNLLDENLDHSTKCTSDNPLVQEVYDIVATKNYRSKDVMMEVSKLVWRKAKEITIEYDVNVLSPR